MVSGNDTQNPLMLLEANLAFEEKVKKFKNDWYRFYKKISKEKTPQVDGAGKKIVRKRPDGLDYIADAYMDECLDKHFPGWSWKRAGGLSFLGSEYVTADGELWIIDERLLAFGVNPPYRVFWGCGAARIQYKSKMPHTPENLVDVDKNVKAANTNAKKVAINRLTGIGDDIYGKRIEEEGAGTYESIVEAKPDAEAFGNWVTDHKGNWTEVMKILGVTSMSEVADWQEAHRKIKEAKGW